MAGYKGTVGSSPLDGVVSFIDGIRHGGRKAKTKAMAPARKVKKVKNAAVNAVTGCMTVGHKGKRGSSCQRCGTKLL